jgi:hypothetical protein
MTEKRRVEVTIRLTIDSSDVDKTNDAVDTLLQGTRAIDTALSEIDLGSRLVKAERVRHEPALTIDAFRATLHASGLLIRKALAEYEATGDHNHWRRPLPPGAPCPGGDCLVSKAREALATIETA